MWSPIVDYFLIVAIQNAIKHSDEIFKLFHFSCVFTQKNEPNAYSVYFTNAKSYSSFQFIGFDTCAAFEKIFGRVYLIHDGHRFTKHHVQNYRTYWRCSASWRYKCTARIISQCINGQEMSKVSYDKHTHFRQLRDEMDES